MSKEAKKSSVALIVLKVVGGIVLFVILLLVGGYCYLKYSLGFDIFKFKRALDLINKPYETSDVVTNSYDDENIVSGLNKMFNANTIYTEEDGNYTFNNQEFEESSLQQDALLSGQELAGILNYFLVNYEMDSELAKSFKLKQIIFSNLVEDESSVSVDLTFSFSINIFSEVNSSDGIVSFFQSYIPKEILITSTTCLTYSKSDCFDYFSTNKMFKINDLSSAETNEILDVLKVLKVNKAGEEIAKEFDNLLLAGIFGSDDEQGFVNCVVGCSGYEFVEISDEVFLKIKKV